jgi:DNA-binding transcriptional LysR family regulator
VFGAAFLDHARAVLAQLRAADEQVRQLSAGDLGTVHVGTHLAGSNLLLPQAILDLRRLHPQVVVTVTEASPDVLQQALLAGELDLIVGRLGRSDDGRLVREKLHDEPIRLVSRRAHPAHELDAPTLADLVGYPWILPGARTALRTELEAAFAEAGVPLPGERVECTSVPTLRHLLVSADFVAALPMYIAVHDQALRLLPTDLRGIRRPVGLTRSALRELGPAAEVLAGCLRDQGRALTRLEPQSPA